MARSKERSFLSANTFLILINVAYFIFIEFIGSSENIDTMLKYGAAYTPYIIQKKEYYRLFTAMFMHFGISHLANNMLVLYLLGDNLERALGPIKYIILFILSGVAANIVSLSWNLGNNNVSAGASGAVFAVMGGLLWCIIKNKGRLEDLSFNQIVISLALGIYYGLTSTGVDNIAHIAGAVSGFILSIILYRGRKWGR